jgi:hypothetical protein
MWTEAVVIYCSSFWLENQTLEEEDKGNIFVFNGSSSPFRAQASYSIP